MLNSVSGEISEKRFDILRVDTGGIEWEFLVCARSMDAFGRVGERTRVFAWLLHTEKDMRLFGFPNEAERAAFLQLLKVDGIGPKAALKILTGIPHAELAAALEAEDLARLERVPGLGHKTSQKLVLALKGKLVSATDGAAAPKAHEHGDIVRALVEMGFERKAAAAAVKDAAAELKGSSADSGEPVGQALEQELFRRALVALSA
ncbi:MAG: Holliday junction branch migration protein RuvA [Spirochaetales bacterium]|nr:Holliday junction branch migration protein RuvA [Spirochaetales bacterium]